MVLWLVATARVSTPRHTRDKRTGMTKLETRIPAGFIGGLTALVPQVAGVNFEEMVEAAVGEKLDPSKPLVDYESGNDIITVWLE